MRIITLNCFLSPWSFNRSRRLPLLVDALSIEKPDLILLQEVFFKSDANYIIKKLQETGLTHHWHSKTLLILSKLPFGSKHFYDFTPKPKLNIPFYIIELLNYVYGKGFQVTELILNNEPMIVVNTHLLSVYGIDAGNFRSARLKQVFNILDKLSSLKSKRVILAGDFNFDINSPTYQALTNRHGFIDPLKNVPGNSISTNNLNRKFVTMVKMNQRIDHIFLKNLKNYRTFGKIVFNDPTQDNGKTTHVSDHYGLLLDIE